MSTLNWHFLVTIPRQIKQGTNTRQHKSFVDGHMTLSHSVRIKSIQALPSRRKAFVCQLIRFLPHCSQKCAIFCAWSAATSFSLGLIPYLSVRHRFPQKRYLPWSMYLRRSRCALNNMIVSRLRQSCHSLPCLSLLLRCKICARKTRLHLDSGTMHLPVLKACAHPCTHFCHKACQKKRDARQWSSSYSLKSCRSSCGVHFKHTVIPM